MIMNPREKDFGAKKEEDPNYIKFSKISTSSSRQWSSYKNPRIVRASRTFGGKDRHSKVSTVRGLRDRRIRLSVPTAVQLYDLQDRLGVSQPSKVVDWLLDATKNEIDKLPPLPIIPGNFTSFHQAIPSSQETSSSSQSMSSSLSHFLNTNQPFLGINQTREGMVKMNERDISSAEKEKWITSHQDQENQEGFGGFLAQNFFPLNNNQSPFPNLPYNSYFHWDPSNLSLSQFGGGGGYSFTNDQDHQSQNNNILNPSITPNSQLYLPSIIPTFPSYITTPPSMENDHNLRQINHLQQQNSVVPTTLHLITSPMKSYPLNGNSKPIQSAGNHIGRRTDKDRRNS